MVKNDTTGERCYSGVIDSPYDIRVFIYDLRGIQFNKYVMFFNLTFNLYLKNSILIIYLIIVNHYTTIKINNGNTLILNKITS